MDPAILSHHILTISGQLPESNSKIRPVLAPRIHRTSPWSSVPNKPPTTPPLIPLFPRCNQKSWALLPVISMPEFPFIRSNPGCPPHASDCLSCPIDGAPSRKCFSILLLKPVPTHICRSKISTHSECTDHHIWHHRNDHHTLFQGSFSEPGPQLRPCRSLSLKLRTVNEPSRITSNRIIEGVCTRHLVLQSLCRRRTLVGKWGSMPGGL